MRLSIGVGEHVSLDVIKSRELGEKSERTSKCDLRLNDMTHILYGHTWRFDSGNGGKYVCSTWALCIDISQNAPKRQRNN